MNLFKTAISLSGISLNWAFDTIPNEQKLHLFLPRHSDMGEAMRSNLTGERSVVFQRCQEKGVTPICGNVKNIVESVVGYNVNALYL